MLVFVFFGGGGGEGVAAFKVSTFLRPSIFAVGNIKERFQVILPDHAQVLYKFPRDMVGDLCSS